jgi:hypothetical protein
MKRCFAIGLLAASAVFSGCGLVFQGASQTIRLTTQPEGATIEFRDSKAVSPATLTFSRRVRDEEIYWASKEGYRPACRVNDCGPPRWIKVLDSIPAAIPLLVDLAAGTLGNCDDIALALDPLRAGDVPFALPSADQIPHEEGAAQGACLFPYLYDSGFAARAERIIVSTGPLQQPHELLGNVDFGRLGFDKTESHAFALRGFAFAWARLTFSKAAPAEINALLRKRALYQYGERVDALINVNYQSDPANSVFATAVAVHFSEKGAASTVSSRLKELEGLRRDGLIGNHEYEEKRAEILRGL